MPQLFIPDRSDWLDYLRTQDYLVAPTEAVDVAAQSVDWREAPPEAVEQFSRRFAAYMLLNSLVSEIEFKQALRDAGLEPGMRLLDVGCASGVNGHFALDLGAAEVVGLDLSESALALARQLSRPPEYNGRLHFLTHDINEPLPFADNEFDAVLVASGETPMYREGTITEYRRVLRSGGRLICTLFGVRKRYAWNSLIDNLLAYAAYLNFKSYWGEDAFHNQEREGYDRLFYRMRAALGMKLWTVPVERFQPVSPLVEQAVQQRFALITGPMFKRNIGAGAEWETLCRLHDAAAPDYLFRRPDLYLCDLIEVATAVLPEVENQP